MNQTSDSYIQAVSAYGSDDYFDEGILPWRARRRDNLLDAQASDAQLNLFTINCIQITQKIAWSRVERKSLHQLLRCPLSGGMLSHVKVCNLPAIMAEHDENIKHSKSGGRDSEVIHCCQTLCMIIEKSSPGLRRWFFLKNHIL